MRFSVIACAFLVSIAMATPVIAQASFGKQRDSIKMPPGETEIQYRKVDDIPRQLRAAIEPSCRYADLLNEHPLRIVHPLPNGSYFAIVHCFGIVFNSIAFTDLHSLKPKPVFFAVKARPDGLGVTDFPGYLEWNGSTQTLTATQSSDVRPSTEWRYSYRYVRQNSPFVLTKIEHRLYNGDRDTPWLLSWETPAWNEPRRSDPGEKR